MRRGGTHVPTALPHNRGECIVIVTTFVVQCLHLNGTGARISIEFVRNALGNVFKVTIS